MQSLLPEGTKIVVNFDGTQFVEESVEELILTLLGAALLTALVCWITRTRAMPRRLPSTITGSKPRRTVSSTLRAASIRLRGSHKLAATRMGPVSKDRGERLARAVS